MRILLAGVALLTLLPMTATAQIVSAGSGSYTTTFPEPPVPGRREMPRGTAFGTEAVPKVSSNLAGQPVPTNDWWSTLVWTTATSTSHGWPFYAYPMSFRSRPDGLAVELTVPTAGPRQYKQPMSEAFPIVVGVQGLGTSESLVHDFSDWTVTAAWFEGGHNFTATIGMGMPFVYFEKGSSETAVVKVNFGSQVTVNGNVILIENNMNGADYAVYGPAGSTWSGNGGEYTSTLNGKNYWSMALLPSGVAPTTAAADWAQYAMVLPGNTM
ncbi:MAG: endo-1,3(4)-beta-glucanase, partial [Bacteroidota bacterium]